MPAGRFAFLALFPKIIFPRKENYGILRLFSSPLIPLPMKGVCFGPKPKEYQTSRAAHRLRGGALLGAHQPQPSLAFCQRVLLPLLPLSSGGLPGLPGECGPASGGTGLASPLGETLWSPARQSPPACLPAGQCPVGDRGGFCPVLRHRPLPKGQHREFCEPAARTDPPITKLVEPALLLPGGTRGSPP